MKTAQAFGILAAILSGPLYIMIMLFCCVRFGEQRSRTIYKVIMVLSFVLAALLMLLLVRNTDATIRTWIAGLLSSSALRDPSPFPNRLG